LAHRYLLVLRFALVNMVAAALSAAAWMQGWLTGLFDPLTATLSGIIFAVFLYGLMICAFRIWQTSRAINDLKAGGKAAATRVASYLQKLKRKDAESRSVHYSMLRLKLSHSVQIVRHVANLLVFLGLIGTVIGFIISLSGVDAQAVSQADSVANMVATLIQGMSIALYTTLLGAVLNVWLNINYRILSTGTVDLYSEIVAFGDGR
jgi:biopolymer transport protein ExbB/TolQ